MPELQKQLQDMRRRDQKPELFPKKLNRVTLGKAEVGPTKYSQLLCVIADQALYGAIRWVDGDKNPASGDALELAEQLARWLPRLYSEMLPLLNERVASGPRVWKVLIEEVFIPTFYLELYNARQHPQGNELSPGDCWYLPRELRGSSELPFARVFIAWLNAAGCRGAEDIGKLTQSDSNRKTASNWLKTKHPPHQKQINRFVNQFRHDTDRFADAQVWKGRLAFAAAMQRACRLLDECFSTTEPRYSFRLLKMLDQVREESVPIDCDHVLMSPKTFFVARMIYRRLKGSVKWQKAIAAIPKNKSVTKRAVTHEEMTAIRKQMLFEMNAGNVLMRFICEEIAEEKRTKSKSPETDQCTTDDIFAHGIRELNRMLLKKGPMAA